MVASWLAVPSGLLVLALSAWWYGLGPLGGDEAPALAPAARQRSAQPHCRCGPSVSLRLMRILRNLFPPRIQHRMGREEELADLTKLSVAQVNRLLGLPPEESITKSEIEALQSLIEENGLTLDDIASAVQQEAVSEDPGRPPDRDYDSSESGEDEEEEHDERPPRPPERDDEDEDEDEDESADYEDRVPPPRPPEPEEHGKPGPGPPEPPAPPVMPPGSVTAGHLGMPLSDEAISAANEVFSGSNLPFDALANPFPQHSFPSDFANYGNAFLGEDAYPLSPVSYYHPVRTFKFRLYVPTFTEFLGFQFASRTSVELYVAKVPGPNQISGIPDAFFERKYWNLQVDVDGNKVISTMPLQPVADARQSPLDQDIVAESDYDAYQAALHAYDHLSRRTGALGASEPTASQKRRVHSGPTPPPGSDRSSPARGSWRDPPNANWRDPPSSQRRTPASLDRSSPARPEWLDLGNARPTSPARPAWPASDLDYDDRELRREQQGLLLKQKAKYGYKRRMPAERYSAWRRPRQR